MSRSIIQNLPNAADLVRMESGELAGYVLEHLHTLSASQLDQASPHNVSVWIGALYASLRDEVQLATYRACEWLIRNEYLETKNDQGFFTVTRKGNSIKTATDFKPDSTQATAAKPANTSPRQETSEKERGASAAKAPGDRTGLAHAEQLYEKVKNLTAGGIPSDESTASIIVELVDDAVKEFGSTNQDKKVELRRIKEKAEEVLPPRTVEELRKRAEGQILKRTFPRNRIIRNVVLLIIGSGTILLGAYEGIEKYREAFKVNSKPQSSSNSQRANITSRTLQAVDFNHQTAEHLVKCEQCHGGFPRNAQPLLQHLPIPGHQPCVGCHVVEFVELKFKIADPASGLKPVGMCFICHDANGLDDPKGPKVKFGDRIPPTLKIP